MAEPDVAGGDAGAESSSASAGTGGVVVRAAVGVAERQAATIARSSVVGSSPGSAVMWATCPGSSGSGRTSTVTVWPRARGPRAGRTPPPPAADEHLTTGRVDGGQVAGAIDAYVEAAVGPCDEQPGLRVVDRRGKFGRLDDEDARVDGFVAPARSGGQGGGAGRDGPGGGHSAGKQLDQPHSVMSAWRAAACNASLASRRDRADSAPLEIRYHSFRQTAWTVSVNTRVRTKRSCESTGLGKPSQHVLDRLRLLPLYCIHREGRTQRELDVGYVDAHSSRQVVSERTP